MANSLTYLDEFRTWGRSGALYPHLLPDEASTQALRDVQQQLLDRNPNAQPTDDFHTTLFYCRPAKLYEYLTQNVDRPVSEDFLYLDLATLFGKMKRDFSPTITAVEGIETFESAEAESTVVLKLEQTNEFNFWRQQVKALLAETLYRHGLNDNTAQAMLDQPEFQYIVGESQPHISVAYGLGHLAVETTKLPPAIRFAHLLPGSVQAPVDDQDRWYAMSHLTDTEV